MDERNERLMKTYATAASSHRLTGVPSHKTERFALDYASWRAHLAAPGSRFEVASPASPRIIQLETVVWPAASAGDERRTA